MYPNFRETNGIDCRFCVGKSVMMFGAVRSSFVRCACHLGEKRCLNLNDSVASSPYKCSNCSNKIARTCDEEGFKSGNGLCRDYCTGLLSPPIPLPATRHGDMVDLVEHDEEPEPYDENIPDGDKKPAAID